MKDILTNQEFPPQNNVNFECVDKSKGLVVGWEKVLLKDYQLNCYR
jgi:hypothetical protein